MASRALNPYFDRDVGPPLVGVLTLDVYRERADREAGRHLRAATACGVLLQQGKYNVTSEHTRTRAIERLTELLCDSIRKQEELAGVEAIIAAPSSTGSGFSEELAQCVAEGSDLDLHLGVNQHPSAPSRKSGGQHRSYRVDVRLPGRVLLLDDVIDEGVTIRALGLAALEAGASECVGLAVARISRA